MFRQLREKVRGRMGLKFVAALSAWIGVLMLAGTLVVARLLMSGQERAGQARAREMGVVLGKASIDRLIAGDLIGLNILVEDITTSPDIIAIFITNTSGNPVTSTRASFNHTNPHVTAIIERLRSEDVRKVAAAVREELDPLAVTVDVLLDRTKLGEVHLFFSRAAMRAGAVTIALLLGGTSIVIVLSLSALVSVMVGRMIVVPTRTAESIATRVAAGDLTHSVPVSTNDEIGSLGRGLNRMIVGLKGMVGSVRDSLARLATVSSDVAGVAANVTAASSVQAESVEEAASSVNEMHYSLKEIAGIVEDLSAASEQTSSAVVETAASIDEVARTMTELSTSIEETASAIAQMSAAIVQIAENVALLTTAVDEASSTATEVSASVREVETSARESASLVEAVAADAQGTGMRSIDQTIEGMRRIEEETRRSAEVINRLGARAESIGGILTVIEDITDQTSLLALNAAILAAQAGEHGKGFAVVAAQIRELATRTAASTQEIGTLIVSVQEESREAVEAMQKGVVLAEEGTRLVHHAGGALTKIAERADHARTMSHRIRSAAAEQAAGMEQVSDAVVRIADMSHQIGRATAEQRGGSDLIARAAERMREITRFVRAATGEQVKASKGITSAVEAMSMKVGLMHRAAGEVRSGSDLIVKAIERIKTTARENAELAVRLNAAVNIMSVQTASLAKEVGRFTTGDDQA